MFLQNSYVSITTQKKMPDTSDISFSSREKKLLVASDDYGRDLTGVQNLLKKHKRLEAELASHEPAVQAVQQAGEKLMDVSNLGVPEIELRLKVLMPSHLLKITVNVANNPRFCHQSHSLSLSRSLILYVPLLRRGGWG